MSRRLMVSMDRGLLDPESGVSKRFKKYAELFDSLDIIVFAKGKKDPVIISSNCAVYPTNSFNKFFYIPDAIFLSKKFKPSVVYAQDPWFETGLAAYLISKIFKSKLLLQVHTEVFSESFKYHSFSNKIRAIFADWLLRKADKIRVVSERIKKSILNRGIEKDISVLPILVKRQEVREQINFPFEKTILTVGRLEKEKNIDLIIDSFSIIHKEYPEVGLVIVGDGRLRKSLEEKVSDLNLKERVKFLGSVNNIFDYYAAADLYVQASDYEGYGMTFVEAALSSLPIITTDVGIVGEVLVDGGSCLVSSRDSNDFSDKIKKVLSDDVLAQSLSGRALEVVEESLIGEEDYLNRFKETFTL